MPRPKFWFNPPSRLTAASEDELRSHLGELFEEGVVVLEWGFAPFGQPCFTRYPTSAANPPRTCHTQSARPLDSNRLYATLIDPISSTRSPRRGKVHGEGETPAQGGKPSAYPPSDSESRSDALAGVQICRQANLSENRRARFGQLRCPRLARSAGSSANHAKRIGRTQLRRARGGACALDNLGTICAQLPTGAGESPFASRFRVA